MKPHNMFNTDDRAVSPVIGVILMVAITVILAAVIGTFVLGLGDSLGDSQPSAQLGVSIDAPAGGSAGNITLEHSGGDSIDSDSLTVILSDASGTESDIEASVTKPLSVGDTATGDFAGGASPSVTDIRVRVIHDPSDSILLDRTIETDAVDFSSLSDLN